MKAIIEIDMPNNCKDCMFKYHNYDYCGDFCFITEECVDRHSSGKFNNTRHDKCPLKPVD